MDKVNNQVAKTYFEQDYRDRGKVKWNGFFLSDHTLAMQQHYIDTTSVQVKGSTMPMPIAQVQQVIQYVWQTGKNLVLQLNIQDREGHLLPAQVGVVESFDSGGVRVAGQVYNWSEILTVRQE